MKQTQFFWHGLFTRPVAAPDMTRDKAARILRHWRSSVRLGRGRLRRVCRDDVHAYLVHWASGEVSGMYVQAQATAERTREEIDSLDPYVREAYFNLEPA